MLEDDTVLREAVSIHGPRAWSAIACGFPRRSSKECCARWLEIEGLSASVLPKRAVCSGPITRLVAGGYPPELKRAIPVPVLPSSGVSSSKPPARVQKARAKPRPKKPPQTKTNPAGRGSSHARRSNSNNRAPVTAKQIPPSPDSPAKRARLSPQAFLEEASMPGLDLMAGDHSLAATASVDMGHGDDHGNVVKIDNTVQRNIHRPQLLMVPAKKVRPRPLHCVADEYCAADEAFLHPRDPLRLNTFEEGELSTDAVKYLPCVTPQPYQPCRHVFACLTCLFLHHRRRRRGDCRCHRYCRVRSGSTTQRTQS